MKVKRVSYGYEVEGAKYISVKTHYISSTMKGYELIVKRIDQEYGYDRIFYSTRFETFKNFLAQYETEKDLLFDYYTARLEGKTRLDFFGNKIYRV